MPAKKPIPEALPQDELVLAALARAERHRNPQLKSGLPIAVIKEHAGLDRRGWSTLQLRPQIERLEAAHLIRRSKRHSHAVWSLTDAGHKRLAEVRAAGTLGPLPESPQHREWRQAREAARLELDQLRTDLGLLLGQALDLLGENPHPPSQLWLDLAPRLARACTWLGSATYCLREWPEPDDNEADLETSTRRKTEEWAKHRTAPGVATFAGRMR